jgi:hypothetical protein
LSPSGNLPITNSEISGTYTTGQNYFRESDCATSTVESLECYGEKKIQFIGSGPNNLNFNIFCDALVPSENVLLKSLNAQFSNGTYKITWEGSIIDEIEYFVVEKSKDGKSFKPTSDKIIAEKGGKYEYVDTNRDIFDSVSFYRILISKPNGVSSYSFTFNGGDF